MKNLLLVILLSFSLGAMADVESVNKNCAKLVWLGNTVPAACLKKLAGTQHLAKFVKYKNGQHTQAVLDEIFDAAELVKPVYEEYYYKSIAGREPGKVGGYYASKL